MKKLYNLYTLYKEIILFFICIVQLHSFSTAQSPVTAIGISPNSIPAVAEANINGAGYSFSQWTTSADFTINYATTAASDILSISSFTAAGNNFIPLTPPGAVTKVRRVGNSVINDARNFITYWNKCSSFPAPGATSGTFNCDAPKVSSMETAMSSNNINCGYDNIFNNTTANPHYSNIERMDFIVPNGFIAMATPEKAGFVVFDRGGGDDFKIAAITSVDGSGNPSAYKTLLSVPISKFSASGLLQSSFDYIIFVSDPNVASGQSRPSTKSNQNIRGVYISMQDLGISANETIYGYSLFGQDVDPNLGHILSDPSTFPLNSSFGSCLDPLNVFTIFQSGIVVLPVKLDAFTGFYNKRNSSVDLTWNTSFEQGLKGFSIEKSNSSTDWADIKNLNASGSSTGGTYFYSDNSLQAASKLFYRLKMINDDGTFQYSNIIFFQLAATNDINLVIAESNLVIKTEINIKEARLFDMAGNQVMPKKKKQSGIDISFSLHSLQSGMYVVFVIDHNNNSFSKKFMKL